MSQNQGSPMTTQCNAAYLDFPMLGPRQVLADFDGGDISSDGGALLLRETERLTGIVRQFAACFSDHRDPGLIEHPVEHLLAQRIYGLALGYEDLNDHDDLRRDPLLAAVVGKDDPTGKARPRQRRRGKPRHGSEAWQSPRPAEAPPTAPNCPRSAPTSGAGTRRSPAAPATSSVSSSP